MDVQTELYLEELTDAVAEADTTTQTDAFLDRPATPLYVPLKVGTDAATQIEAGELFNFDLEVEPLLEVLVGKTLEQALQEVCEEEELAALAAHQAHFEALRNAELAAAQRMEAAERRRAEEKERRLAQARERAAAEKRLREKIAAQTFARSYVSGLVSGVFDQLTDKGFFFDPLAREVETSFLPWLSEHVVEEIRGEAQAQEVIDALVAEALAELAAARVRAEADRTEAKRRAEEEAAAAAAEAERLAEDARQNEEAANALLNAEPLIVPVDVLTAARDVLTDSGATFTFIGLLDRLLADSSVSEESVVETARSLGVAFPRYKLLKREIVEEEQPPPAEVAEPPSPA